ncbi:3-hydroxyacyl-CoA dehydrogenase [Roseibium hamelinense]|uniref:L-gulonate 3-dehydrogenase n=2 Tax=Roseibium hamelinense TaxID=150831 RepID=A0A562SU27_9HYPH|nr:3-hydroxyacyl-CoA dehydrogenase [Roseibium hamelinense]
MKIALVGSGFIGRAWAISFARAGYETALWDGDPSSPHQAIGYIEGMLSDLADQDLLNGSSPDDILKRLVPVADLADALDGATHIQESTPERLEVKQQVFADLDRLAAPDAVIASSTSALLPSKFTGDLQGRARCLVAHPINPPYLIPAVEIVPAPWTSEPAMERTRQLMLGAGQAPIMMQRELDGFIMNRMQAALMEEAFRLVADGHASVEDVDIGIREGLALRWAFMGPFETVDLNAPAGVRDYAARYQPMFENLFKQMQYRVDWTGPVLDQIEAECRAKRPAETLEARQKWRDRSLMALAAHKKKMREALSK